LVAQPAASFVLVFSVASLFLKVTSLPVGCSTVGLRISSREISRRTTIPARRIEFSHERSDHSMTRPIDKSSHQAKASRRAVRALRPVPIATSWHVAAGAIATLLLVSSAAADDDVQPNWSYQAHPMASSFEYCSKYAPTDPKNKDQVWSKVLETIQAAADKWKYSRKEPDKTDPKKDATIFQFRFLPGDCPRCPGLNYIEFGKLKDDQDTWKDNAPKAEGEAAEKKVPRLAKITNFHVTGTTDPQLLKRMTGCSIRFNSDVDDSWYVVGDDGPKDGQYDLFSVALHALGHCVGLKHVSSGTFVSSGTLKANAHPRDLDPADDKARRAIYGEP
jgi:hypothetical protein